MTRPLPNLLLLLLALLAPLQAQQPPTNAANEPAAASATSAETAPLQAVDRQHQVSVLCYHDFTAAGNPTPMRMKTADFRAQMESLRAGGVSVISMADFLAWRRGEADIPDRSVVLTFDDGWRSVYEEAFPVLQELGYPFVIYLYQNFIDIGGQSMTKAEVLDLLAHGGTLGSHSVSHPYPQSVLAVINRNDPEALASFLRKELKDSRAFLESQFQVPVTTYAYPGGFYNDQIRDFGLNEAGYQDLFTVNPARALWDNPRGEVNRFVIHGDDPATFAAATTFHGVPLGGAAQHEGIRVRPEPNSIISERLPLIEVDLSSVGPIKPESLVLRLDGFGQVPAVYDPQRGLVRYALRSPLRDREQRVTLSWQRANSSERDSPLNWTFQINRAASYEPFALDANPHLAEENELRAESAIEADPATTAPAEPATNAR